MLDPSFHREGREVNEGTQTFFFFARLHGLKLVLVCRLSKNLVRSEVYIYSLRIAIIIFGLFYTASLYQIQNAQSFLDQEVYPTPD